MNSLLVASFELERLQGSWNYSRTEMKAAFFYLPNGNRPQRVKIFPWIAGVLSVTLFGAEAWNPTQFNYFHLCSYKGEPSLKTANGEITTKANSALILSCEKYWLHHWRQSRRVCEYDLILPLFYILTNYCCWVTTDSLIAQVDYSYLLCPITINYFLKKVRL